MDTLYRVIRRLLWSIYLQINRHRPISTPTTYLDPGGLPCVIDADGRIIIFGVSSHE